MRTLSPSTTKSISSPSRNPSLSRTAIAIVTPTTGHFSCANSCPNGASSRLHRPKSVYRMVILTKSVKTHTLSGARVDDSSGLATVALLPAASSNRRRLRGLPSPSGTGHRRVRRRRPAWSLPEVRSSCGTTAKRLCSDHGSGWLPDGVRRRRASGAARPCAPAGSRASRCTEEDSTVDTDHATLSD